MDVFIRILCNNGHRISVYDIDKKKTVNLSNQYKCKPCKSIQEIAKESDTVILCTPLKETPYIINQVTKYITPGSMIVEIASLKKRTIAALRRHEDKIKPLSIHPMFGPDIKEIRGHTIVVVPVKNQVLESNFAQNLFPEAEIIIADEDAHDKSMAFILSLPYFMNTVFAKCIPPENLLMIRKLAGPTFKAQLAVSQSVVGEDPILIESLIEENVFAGDLINMFIDELKYLRRMLKSKPLKVVKYCKDIKDSMIDDPEFAIARENRNRILENF